jgi:hypothetical protein
MEVSQEGCLRQYSRGWTLPFCRTLLDLRHSLTSGFSSFAALILLCRAVSTSININYLFHADTVISLI